MSTDTPDMTYWLCQTGPNKNRPHELLYRGKGAQRYICKMCGWEVMKADLKAHTD